MTHTVGPKGQVVIPKAMREAIGLRPGDRVEFELEQGTVRVAASRAVRARKGAFRGHQLVARLEADRRSEPK
jgi:antitoxin PrlF